MTRKKRTSDQKIKLFRSFFSGLNDVYGTYDKRTGRVRQVKRPVTDDVIHRHLRGRQPYGVYLLIKDRTRAIAVDFDVDELHKPIQFVRQAGELGLSSYIERSKSKGYHVWIFFPEGGVLAAKARLVVRHLLAKIGSPDIEIFPKQDSLDHGITYGNFINAPLFGALVARGRTVFVDPAHPTRPYANQWDFLGEIRRVSEGTLDAIIARHKLASQQETSSGVSPPLTNDNHKTYFSLPACARRMLAEGVKAYQRVACFRLAVGLKRAGLPYDITVAALKVWARKNKPSRDKHIITIPEIISQTTSAYNKDYRGYGCEDPAVRPYCDPQCPILKKKLSNSPSSQNNNQDQVKSSG